MIIPHSLLNPETLRGVIEAFVTREGTEYGERDVTLETKVGQVKKQLDEGTAVIVYNDEDESCSIVPKERAPKSRRSAD